MEPFIGEIKLVPYNFAPRGWAMCNGQLMAINQNQALFSLLGTFYGGNGVQTFALPNLQGSVIVGTGNGASPYVTGERGGAMNVTLTVPNLPAHAHQFNVVNAEGTLASPVGAHLAATPAAIGNVYATSASPAVNSSATSLVGGSQPHSNAQPYLVLTYIIALQGIFPSRS